MTIPRDQPLGFGTPAIGEAEIAEVVDTLRGGWLTTGPRVARFERQFARTTGAANTVAVGSCTGGIHISLVAAGVGRGDEVITSPLTFCATAHAIVHAGASPVFADVDPLTRNIDPRAVEAAIGPRTAAIIPVHLAGRPCEMDELEAIARRHGLLIVEDAAHAAGASYHGRSAGTIGDTGCFSFYATKSVATGEGGMVTVRDAQLAERIRLYAHHGLAERTWDRDGNGGYRHQVSLLPGFKCNMTDLQAALGIHQLARLDEEIAGRADVWRRYDERFADLPLERPAPAPDGVRHGRHLYSVLVRTEETGTTRDQVLAELSELGIGAGVHFTPVHLHPYYRETTGGREGQFPNAEHIGARTLSLPLSSVLSEEDVDDVVAAVERAVGAAAGAAAR
jgi:dTDP-4-amino-4,6-dideoxygalactose transaminase